VARPRKYATEEERLAARREQQRAYYARKRQKKAMSQGQRFGGKRTENSPPKQLRPIELNCGTESSFERVVLPDGSYAPIFSSWNDFLQRTSATYRKQWLRGKVQFANTGAGFGRPQVWYPKYKLTIDDVWDILCEAKGHCAYCGSLAVEKAPAKSNGAFMSWESIGRRIGSLDHIKPRSSGGDNNRENLCWCCLWCNTWPSERIPGATDHGGYYPND
jgi:hypothetical protein